MIKTELFIHHILEKGLAFNYISARKALMDEIQRSFKVKLNPAIAVICYYTDQLQFFKFLEEYDLNVSFSSRPNLALSNWQIYGHAIPKGIPISSIICDSLNSVLEDQLKQDRVQFCQVSESCDHYGFKVIEKDMVREIHIATQSNEQIFLDTRLIRDFWVGDNKKIIYENQQQSEVSVGFVGKGNKLIPWIRDLRERHLLENEIARTGI
jgi:hypothetical protein